MSAPTAQPAMNEKDDGGSAREGPSAPAMGRTVGGGISWIVVSTILSKLFTSVAQVALGWLLTREEFGMYAQATAAFGILSLLRDGGASTILIQRGARDYAQVSGALFWMAMVFSTASAVGLAAIARPLSVYWYEQPAITTLILILAISMPIGVPGFMLLGKLRIDLRFAEYSKQQTWSALVRQVSTVLFAASGLMAQVVGVVLMLAWVGNGAPAAGLGGAWHDVARWAISWGGLGAMSLVLPILVVALFDFATAFRLTRDPPVASGSPRPDLGRVLVAWEVGGLRDAGQCLPRLGPVLRDGPHDDGGRDGGVLLRVHDYGPGGGAARVGDASDFVAGVVDARQRARASAAGDGAGAARDDAGGVVLLCGSRGGDRSDRGLGVARQVERERAARDGARDGLPVADHLRADLGGAAGPGAVQASLGLDLDGRPRADGRDGGGVLAGPVAPQRRALDGRVALCGPVRDHGLRPPPFGSAEA
jgi:hypothetical protein